MKKPTRRDGPVSKIVMAALVLTATAGFVSGLTRNGPADGGDSSVWSYVQRFFDGPYGNRQIAAQSEQSASHKSQAVTRYYTPVSTDNYGTHPVAEPRQIRLVEPVVVNTTGVDANGASTLDPNVFNRNTIASTTAFADTRTSSGMGPLAPTANSNGIWIANVSANWSDTTRWSGGIVADGAGFTADFSTVNITAGRTVTVDTARTIGTIKLGDIDNGSNYTITASPGISLTMDGNGSNAQINQTSGAASGTISAPLILNSSLDVTNASATNGNLTFSGGITAGTAGTKTITTSTGLVTVSAAISDGNGIIAIAQNGPGTLALGNVANTYTGGTTIAGGSITIGGSGSPLGSGGTLTLSGGTLVATSSRASSAALPLNVVVTADSAITTTSAAGTPTLPFTGTLTGSGGTLTIRNDAAATTGQFEVRFSGGDYVMSRPIVLNNGAGGGSVRLADFNSSGSTHTYNGIISGGGGYNRSVSSGGGGTTIFNADNSYTGITTIGAGTLLVNGNQTLATGNVNVTSIGTVLGGTGTVGGATTVNANAIILGGNGTTGTTLTVNNNLTMSSGSIIELALGPALAHSTLARSAGTWTFDATQAFTFINLGATTGTYDNIISGLAVDPGSEGTWTITNAGIVGSFVYDGAGGIDFTLTAVPEPSTWVGAALALGAIGVMARKRVRKAETLTS
jgi:autotransporter-associated beta strand protein